MNTSVHLFQSLPTNTFSLTLQIQHHITNEHYSRTLLFTSFNHFQPTHSHSLSKSNITSQTNITEDTSVHLFQSLPTNTFSLTLQIQHHITNEHYSTTLLFTSFNHFQPTHSHSLSKSNITSQTNITQHTSVHLFQSLPTNTFSLTLQIQHHITNEHYSHTSVHLFQSLPTNTFSLTLQIQHHITNEHYSPHFCSPLSITSNQHILTHSPNPTSHHKRTLLSTLLFTSFNHFQPTHSHSLSKSNITSQTNITHNTSVHLFQSLPTNTFSLTLHQHPTSHHKRTLLKTLLFTSFNHFQPTHSHSLSKSNITSQTNITHDTSVHLFQSLPTNTFSLTLQIQHHITNDSHYSSDTSVHLFQSLPTNTFPLTLQIQHHITNEHYSAHFCSPLSITSNQHILTHSPNPTSHHKRTLLSTLLFTSFNHFQPTHSHSLSKSNITSQTNITHNTSVHLFQSLPTNTFSLTLQIQHHITNEHYS